MVARRQARALTVWGAALLLSWLVLPAAAAQGQGQVAPENSQGTTASGSGSANTVSPLDAFLASTKFGVDLDGYYEYNFDNPLGRVNLLRPYDVTSNSFSLNQIGIVIDHAPDAANGHRAGVRIDFMYGQATETLQGNAVNEPRPQVYRPLFQAYGSYVFPVGSGLQVDFGKFASALGVEGNYTKDQLNYSRSYFFNFLPYYHMGFRTTYAVNSRVSFTYWLVNGAQQTEDFNGFKSQAAIITLTPAKSVSWNVNYYTGKEGRDLQPDLNPGLASLPTEPGLSTIAVANPDQSRTHIVDTYATWNAAPKLTFVGEADYVTVRPPGLPSLSLSGGAGYVQYRIRPDVHLAARTEYMNDRDGLFSGRSQHLHEATGTFSWFPQPDFLVRLEARRDWSNQPFFLSDQAGVTDRAQTTLTLGMVWWFGNKTGGW